MDIYEGDLGDFVLHFGPKFRRYIECAVSPTTMDRRYRGVLPFLLRRISPCRRLAADISARKNLQL